MFSVVHTCIIAMHNDIYMYTKKTAAYNNVELFTLFMKLNLAWVWGGHIIQKFHWFSFCFLGGNLVLHAASANVEKMIIFFASLSTCRQYSISIACIWCPHVELWKNWCQETGLEELEADRCCRKSFAMACWRSYMWVTLLWIYLYLHLALRFVIQRSTTTEQRTNWKDTRVTGHFCPM